MAHQFSSFKQQQGLEDDLSCSDLQIFREMDNFLEDAITTMTKFQEKAYNFKQFLLGMRKHAIEKQNSDHHPREEAAAEPSVQASTISEEQRLGEARHKFKLCFNGSLKTTIYTNTPLLGQSNNGGIEIAICEDGQIITSGRLASLTVEIVAFEKDHTCKGKWTEEDFDCQIRKSRDGQGSVLDGECRVNLVNGKASLGNVHFKEGSTGTRSREFVLAARVCRSENIRVQEAFMDPPFVVKSERSRGNEKSPIPKLTDKVHYLKGIQRNGIYAKRLEEEKIDTVEAFLKAYNKDPTKLHQILQIRMVTAWDTMVKHAMECDLSHRPELRSYRVEVANKNVSLFFNCVDDLVGAEFNDVFIAKDMFDSEQKTFVYAHLQQAHSKLDNIQVEYVLKNNHPVKILTNIVATGSSHQATLQAPRPGSGIDCTTTAPGHPLGGENPNPAGQSSSELSRPVRRRNGHEDQGLSQNCVPNPKGYTVCHADAMNTERILNKMPGCSSEGTLDVAGTPSRYPPACSTSNSSAYLMENNHPIPKLLGAIHQEKTLLGAASQNAFAEENMRPLGSGIDSVTGLPLGEANRNAAGHSASGPFLPDHYNGRINQGLGQHCNTDPEGGSMISADSTSANVDHVDNMDETWALLQDYMQQETNTKPVCSPGETYAELVMPDSTIYDTTCSGYIPADSQQH
ncbi:unnamed protein product [Urochloa humidicola]